MANRLPADPRAASILKVKRAAEFEEAYEMSEVLRIYANKGFLVMKELHSHFTLDEINQLHGKTTCLLLKSTYLNHVNRIEKMAASLFKQMTANKEQSIRNSAKKLAHLAAAKREYNVSENPEYLVFEYVAKFLIRNEILISALPERS